MNFITDFSTILFYSDFSYLFTGFIYLAFGSYILLAGGSFLYFYILHKNEYIRNKIQEEPPSSGDILREILWSLSTTIIYILFAAVLVILVSKGYTKLYFDSGSAVYFIFSVILMVLIHDAYFYWAHRFMHSSAPIFKLVHNIHHRSVNPTPFAIHSFGPLEAMLQAAFVPLILFTIPLHLHALLIWFLIEIVFNCLGHLGYELFPLKAFNTPIGKWLNSPTHHNMHHQESRTDFGHYFNFWDRLMKTNSKNYETLLKNKTKQNISNSD